MSRVRIKYKSNGSNIKGQILNIFNNFNIKCSKLSPSRNQELEFLAHCNSDQDADLVFGNDCTAALSAIECTAIMPIKLKIKLSVLIKRVDAHIYDHSVVEIQQEVNATNPNYQVTDVYKFPNSKTMKITFANHSMAESCLVNGIKLFMLHISSFDIQREEYVEVKTCYKCFSLNSHFTHECQKEPDYLICSKCADTGHSFRSCTATQKKCINCLMPHPTLSYSCPKRKEIVKNKMSPTSYASVINPSNPVASEKVNLEKITESITKSILCLIVATEKDKEDPGCFTEVLGILQKNNNVPDFKMGSISLPKSFTGLVDATEIAKSSNSSTSVNDCVADVPNVSLASNNVNPIIYQSSTSSNLATNDFSITRETSTSLLENSSNTQRSSRNVQVSPRPKRTQTSDVPAASSSSASTVIKPKISITKSKSCPQINSGNLEKLFNEGLISFQNSQGFSSVDCLEYFRNNLLDCKTAISKAKILDQKALRSGNTR